eukprot:3936072-Karenia_brevis.AAC.1
MDPAVSAHPNDDLVRRGNGKQVWWTCKLCLRRWERLPLSKFEPTGAVTEGADLVTFGKHMGMTYNQTWQEDPTYCQWVMMTAEQEDSCSTALR